MLMGPRGERNPLYCGGDTKVLSNMGLCFDKHISKIVKLSNVFCGLSNIKQLKMIYLHISRSNRGKSDCRQNNFKKF